MSTPSTPSWVAGDPLQAVALVARARRATLMHAYRHRLSREDLEDCYSQATFELLHRAQQGRAFSGHRHIANALELRFESRIQDRRRAVRGRSGAQTALATSLRIGVGGQNEPADPRLDVEPLVDARLRLQRVCELASGLTSDQQLVLRSQLAGVHPSQLCAQEGWSLEKYRKVAQRARARLRALVDAHALPERPTPLARALPERPSSRRLSDERAGTT